MTLDDALKGLLQYWSVRPDGGNRAELINLAIAAGFQEPLLNGWLDVFLQGFVSTGYIEVANYDTHLVPKLQAVGVPAAARAARAVFVHLTEQGSELDVVKKQNLLIGVDEMLATLATQINGLQNGIASVAAMSAFSGRAAILAAGNDGLARLQARRASLLAQKAAIEEEIGG